MTPAQAIEAALPGDDERVKASRIALLKLLNTAVITEAFLVEVADWIALAIEDPAIVFSEGDLPLVATHLEARLAVLAEQTRVSRDALVALRIEWLRFRIAKRKEKAEVN